MEANLICSLTRDIFEDPITVPCCGKSYDRVALAQWYERNTTCPECRRDLTEYNYVPLTAQTNRSLMYMLEAYKNPNKSKINDCGHEWIVELTPIPDSNMAQLFLRVNNAKYVIKPVLNPWLVDVSGSMNRAWPQVRSALMYIMGMVASNPGLVTYIIPYDSSARHFKLTGNTRVDEPEIDRAYTGGGTYFRSAFIEAGTILKYHKELDAKEPNENLHMSSANIFFMTDGQDGGDKSTLKSDFDDIITHAWNKPYTVHTIGFSSSCDQETLENVRSAQGTYRFADPNDDADTLCSKLQSLFDLSIKSTSAKLRLNLLNGLTTMSGQTELDIDMPIGPLQDGEYKMWVKIPTTNQPESYSVVINSDLETDFSLDVKYNDPSPTVYDKWLSTVLDNIASELIQVAKVDNHDGRKLHCSLILHKLEKINGKSSDTERIAFLSQQAQYLLEGGRLDINRLNDMRFSSQFNTPITKSKPKPSTNNNSSSYQAYTPPKITAEPEWTERSVYYTHADTIKVRAVKDDQYVRDDNDEPVYEHMDLKRNDLQKAIMHVGYENQPLCTDREQHAKNCSCAGQRQLKQELKQLVENCTVHDLTHTDYHGNNALMLAAYCGFYMTIDAILKRFTNIIDIIDKIKDVDAENASNKIKDAVQELINRENDKDETAVTLAIKNNGYHNTMTLLMDHGAIIPNKRLKGLQKFALSEGYKKTGEILAAEGMDVTTADENMTAEYIIFMYNNAKKKNKTIDQESYYRVALKYAMENNTMFTMLRELIKYKGVKSDINTIRKYGMPPKPDYPKIEKYVELHEFLVRHNPELLTAKDDKQDTMLIIAVENGNLELVQFYLQQGQDIEGFIEEPNEMGNSPLWVATAKKWPCIVDALIDEGADPNHLNEKGNGPLYASCLCGPVKIAQALILAGADFENFNKINDTLVLSCCRNGQPEVLELLLTQVDPKTVSYVNPYDGFDAVKACAETRSKNGAECLQKLFEYGVDLNAKSADDGKYLPGSAPLHIAAYLNNLFAAHKLIELGADVNVLNVYGQTALHVAVMQGHSDIVKLLRTTKIVKDQAGNTPLDYCTDNEEIRKMLIDPMYEAMLKLCKGQYTTDAQKYSLKVLHSDIEIVGCITASQIANISPEFMIMAVIYNNFPVIELLVKMGVKCDVPNTFGVTAITMIKWVNNPKIKNIVGDITDDDGYDRLKQCASNMTNRKVLTLMLIHKNATDLTYSGLNERMTNLLNDVKQVEHMIPRLENSTKTAIDIFKRAKITNYDNNLWHARLQVINLVVNNELILNPTEMLALALYTNTADLAGTINQGILDNNVNTWVYPYAQQVLTALDKLPNYEGEVFIGGEHINRSVFMVDNEISWPTMRSSSTMWTKATTQVPNFLTGKKRHGTVFLIKCNTGKLVTRYSQFATDCEVIILPGTKFKVSHWYTADKNVFSQENNREYTFDVKPEKREEYLTHMSLIIELTEI